MTVTVEVNSKFKGVATTLRLGDAEVMFTPPLDRDYYIARVSLVRDQAVVIFPKFGVIGCGFALEEDWNTNLPIYEPAETIYAHIEHNRRYDEITKEDCIEAIEALQSWTKSRGLWRYY